MYTPDQEEFIGAWIKISRSAHLVSKDKGFWDYGLRNSGEMIALIHSELSEALEALRDGSNDKHLPHFKGVEVELADVVLRIMDMCYASSYDIQDAIVQKLEFNKSRPHKHGRLF